jgi:8-oxo-dGTP pyrophosphatase MutT (NUDIX family)
MAIELPRRGVRSEVVMVVPRTDGRVLLMTKAFYPPGVYRLPTGGIHDGEDPEAALRRELYEETGLILDIQRFLGRLDYEFHRGDNKISYTSYIYILQPTDEEPHVHDADEQITGFRTASIAELRCVVDNLLELGQGWRDWARFRAIAHQFVVENLCKTVGEAI